MNKVISGNEAKTFRVLLIISICTFVALFFLGQQLYWSLALDKKFDFWPNLCYELLFTYTWGLLLYPIIMLAKRFRIEKNDWTRNLSIHICAAIIVALLHKLVSSLSYFILVNPDIFFQLKFSKAFLKILGGSFDSFIVYWFILGAYYGYDYYYKLSKSKIKESELEKELAQANLQALKMQLHPHFLFNTLHAVSALMQEDINTARKMLVKLSDLLRTTLDNIGVQEINFSDEIDFLKSYLEIEQIRFGKRLVVNYNIEPNTLSATVPNLILQPLVENAIKHGISKNKDGGTINIHADKIDNNIHLRISNDGPCNNTPQSNGIGLANTRKRLSHLYGETFTMTAMTQEKGYCVDIIIPYKEYCESTDKENG